jgi:hypothetical protein
MSSSPRLERVAEGERPLSAAVPPRRASDLARLRPAPSPRRLDVLRSPSTRSFRLLVALSLSALVACGGDDDAGEAPDPPLEPTYENVAMILQQSCTFSASCHGGTGAAKARLNFERAAASGTILDVLLEVPSCEYSAMPRVTPGDPARSWLWIKVDGETDARGNLLFSPSPDWDAGVGRRPDGTLAASTCPLVVDGGISFGMLMPMGSRRGLSENRRRAIYEWILAGAPGPGGAPYVRDGGVSDLGPPDAGERDADVPDDAGAPEDAGAADDASAPEDAGAADDGT